MMVDCIHDKCIHVNFISYFLSQKVFKMQLKILRWFNILWIARDTFKF
jgi:hypothetical protein